MNKLARTFAGQLEALKRYRSTGEQKVTVEHVEIQAVFTFCNEYAYEFSFDVYSRNKPLQERLDKIAWAGYAGGMSMSVALMPVGGAAGAVISVSRLSKTFKEIFRTTPPNELREQNGPARQP